MHHVQLNVLYMYCRLQLSMPYTAVDSVLCIHVENAMQQMTSLKGSTYKLKHDTSNLDLRHGT